MPWHGKRDVRVDEVPLQQDDDVLGVEDIVTHPMPLQQAPQDYERFQKKREGAIKVVLKPGMQ